MSSDAPAPPAPTCRDAEAVLGAYALEALGPEERETVAAHLDGCPGCRMALARYERATTALGLGVAPVAPPPALARRLLTEIERGTTPVARPIAPTIGVTPTQAVGEGRRWRWAAGGLATVAALLLVGLVVVTVWLRQTQEVSDDAVADRRELAEYLGGGGKITALVPATGAPAAGQGSLIVAPNQPRAALVVSNLATGGERRYRVWVERDGERTWLTDLEVEPDGIGYAILSAPEPLVSYDTIGIALEAPGQTARDLLVAPIGSAPG
jgi:hypothetical protein